MIRGLAVGAFFILAASSAGAADQATVPGTARFCGKVEVRSATCIIVHPSMVDGVTYEIDPKTADPRKFTNNQTIGGSGHVRRTAICDKKYVRLTNVKWQGDVNCALNK